MNDATKQLVLAATVVFGLAGGLGWWAYQVTQAPTLSTAAPTTSTVSPLSSTVVAKLRQRQLYGSLPVQPIDPSNRADPFVNQ